MVSAVSRRTVGITGSSGLIGWHLRCRLLVEEDLSVIVADRACFRNEKLIDDFVENCDVVVHLAGMNRGDEKEVESVNVALASRLVDSFERTGCAPHVIFSSSTHISRDTGYGRSKRIASESFRSWADKEGATFSNLVLPHVFGEHGKPFSNSVVSTFCYQLSQREAPVVQVDGMLELLHAQDVSDRILEIIRSPVADDIRIEGTQMRVSEMLALLAEMKGLYENAVIPSLGDSIHLSLFNTLRSYLYPAFYPVKPELHEDPRGSLFEAVKTVQGGQAFMSSTKPGVTRGNHFHFRKFERFLVVEGDALISIRRLFGNETVEFTVSGDTPSYVDIPTLHTHAIKNTGTSELKTLFWAHEIFDPGRPDTHAVDVFNGEDIS